MSQQDTKNEAFFVIYSANEAATSGDGAGFWNNEDGWTILENATLFTESETVTFSLPLSTGLDAQWARRNSFGALVDDSFDESEAPGLEVTLKVSYALNGMSLSDLQAHLEASLNHAIGNGLLSGHSEAEVETYSVDIKQVNA